MFLAFKHEKNEISKVAMRSADRLTRAVDTLGRA
jgi:hypothetical protein